LNRQANNEVLQKINLFKQKCDEEPELAKARKILKTILINCISLYVLLIIINLIFTGFDIMTIITSLVSLLVLSLFCVGIMNGVKILAILPLIGCIRSLFSIIVSIFPVNNLNIGYIIYAISFGVINIILLSLYLYILFSTRIKKYETVFKAITQTK